MYLHVRRNQIFLFACALSYLVAGQTTSSNGHYTVVPVVSTGTHPGSTFVTAIAGTTLSGLTDSDGHITQVNIQFSTPIVTVTSSGLLFTTTIGSTTVYDPGYAPKAKVLSSGAKAGIGVGVTVGVLALLLVFVGLCLRRRLKPFHRRPESVTSPDLDAKKSDHFRTGKGISELGPNEHRGELEAGIVGAELPAPVGTELEASPIDKKGTFVSDMSSNVTSPTEKQNASQISELPAVSSPTESHDLAQLAELPDNEITLVTSPTDTLVGSPIAISRPSNFETEKGQLLEEHRSEEAHEQTEEHDQSSEAVLHGEHSNNLRPPEPSSDQISDTSPSNTLIGSPEATEKPSKPEAGES
jgi:hypothetical protein